MHSAVANPYAHVTAPLRRLVDRFGLVVCEALSAGSDVPAWVKEVLPSIPAIMKESDRLANSVERACTNAVEAAELRSYVGKTLDGVVVQLVEPAVVERASGSAEEGVAVKVRVDAAEIETGTVKLSVVS